MTNKITTLGIQIVPKTSDSNSYELVDKAISVIQNSGVKHIITPFETVMEGNYEELMSIARKAQEAVIHAGAEECLIYYRIHLSTVKDITFEDKKLDR
jgi:uncharacterized protein YqgV (UPF0045/DUF77 family)